MQRKKLRGNTEYGFTLLEIMLVIVIMAVTSMMIAPSYFSAISVSVDDEGKRLVQALRLASEEATLSGNTFRVRFRQHSYQFQSADQQGVWQSLQEAPYQPYTLVDGIQIVDVKPSVALKEQVEEAKKGVEPILADLFVLPEGIMKISDIVLAYDPEDGRKLTVFVRPGPGGIAIKKDKNGQ